MGERRESKDSTESDSQSSRKNIQVDKVWSNYLVDLLLPMLVLLLKVSFSRFAFIKVLVLSNIDPSIPSILKLKISGGILFLAVY